MLWCCNYILTNKLASLLNDLTQIIKMKIKVGPIWCLLLILLLLKYFFIISVMTSYNIHNQFFTFKVKVRLLHHVQQPGSYWDRSSPVNIRNVFKWFKHLQNVFKTLLNHILWFSKCFQGNVYAVMFKKRFINILYTNIFIENV